MPNIPPEYVGLDNFKILFQDTLFYRAWLNTLLFIGTGIIFGFFVPVVIAVTVNEVRRGAGLFRLGFYLPVIIPMVVVTLVWKFLYLPDEGLFDSILKLVGLKPVNWLINKNSAMVSLVIMGTWKNAGATMIIYLAAIQGVPPQLYEAAEIDGATIWQRVRHITIPHIMPLLLIILILQIIGSAQVFIEPLIMTGGGPDNATLTVLYHIYNTAFQYFNFGLAAAMSLILFMVLVSFTVVYFIILKRKR
jgi:multiple sugar transport system permease protein